MNTCCSFLICSHQAITVLKRDGKHTPYIAAFLISHSKSKLIFSSLNEQSLLCCSFRLSASILWTRLYIKLFASREWMFQNFDAQRYWFQTVKYKHMTVYCNIHHKSDDTAVKERFAKRTYSNKSVLTSIRPRPTLYVTWHKIQKTLVSERSRLTLNITLHCRHCSKKSHSFFYPTFVKSVYHRAAFAILTLSTTITCFKNYTTRQVLNYSCRPPTLKWCWNV